jgi:hypothetical protein
VQVRDLPGGGNPRPLKGHQDTIHAVAFTPNGELVANATDLTAAP